jgi:hypothetical protein
MIALTVVLGCAPDVEGPDPEAAATLEAFLAAANAGEPVDELVTEDFVLAAPEHTELQPLLDDRGPLELASEIDGHHEILRAWISQGDELQWLFTYVQDHRLSWIALFSPPPDGEQASAEVTAYQEAWNTRDETERASLLQESWATDGHYVDPTGEATGREELGTFIGDFRKSLPGARVVVRSDMAEHHDFVHFRWQARGLAGTIRAQGMDVGRLDSEGRLSFIGGYFGPLDPED